MLRNPFLSSVSIVPKLLLALPVKPFSEAKRRLQLEPSLSVRLGRALAQHTLDVIRAAGFDVGVVTGDGDVAEWAASNEAELFWEKRPRGLNAAARLVAAGAARSGRRWGLLHADLPLLRPGDLNMAWDRPCLAPSYDGGTSLLAGVGADFSFSYGPGSFQRHLAACGGPATIVIRPGLAYDLDSELDLARAGANAPWLAEILSG
jgi:2-phospho-L-lactate guanylyltransferase